ncbi:hypothetical protein [Bacillus sp. FJAT-27445]|uniref:hypothetical protein n=1 Tax=Bacillus sp. FJAT-27445 TaxID=1679166 RepID=UPI00074448CA|nr:hypothetical protein [Bacillus sp. FJAT-27445]
MKKQNNHPNEFDFLLPLTKRNDLEPHVDFVESLRSKLTQTSNEKMNQPDKMRITLASSLALITFCILAFSFSDTISMKNELSQKREQRIPPTEVPTASDIETPPPLETHSYDLNELLTNYPYYHDLYQSLSKAIQSEEGAKVFILYLHALQQNDMDEIKKQAFTRMESEIEDLIEIYNKIDYATITIDKAIPSKAEPSYEVQLGYQLRESNNPEKRTIHIHLNDGVTITIYEPDIALN